MTEVKAMKHQNQSNRGKANVGDAISRVTEGKIVKFLVCIPEANAEIVDTQRSVVVQNRINSGKEEAAAKLEANMEEKDKAYVT